MKDLDGFLRSRAEGGVVLAFSGGADSMLLLLRLAALKREADFPLYAVTVDNGFQTPDELSGAAQLAAGAGVPHVILPCRVLDDPEIRFNPPDRCYRCKKKIFQKLCDFASEHGCQNVFDGTNADDLGEYRPGLKALKELRICSPLAELGICKAQIRGFLKECGCAVAFKPSSPCLATRFPHGTELTGEALKRVADAERFLHEKGFSVVRVRAHGILARIEILPEEFSHLLEIREETGDFFRRSGFVFVTLDISGFHSGSMEPSST